MNPTLTIGSLSNCFLNQYEKKNHQITTNNKIYIYIKGSTNRENNRINECQLNLCYNPASELVTNSSKKKL